jgi:HAMP domain-containing protein
MQTLTRDPLLAVAKGVMILMMAVLGLGILVCALAIPGMWIAQTLFANMLAPAFHGVAPYKVMAAFSAVLFLIAVLLVMILLATRLLKQIVDTVAEGDPFVPANARRLTRIAWLALAVQAVSLPIGAIGVWLAQYAGPDTDIDIDGGVSVSGLLMVLVLFVLARVFRQGAAMREELEGTV